MAITRLLLFVFEGLKLPSDEKFDYFERPVQHIHSLPAKTDRKPVRSYCAAWQ
jgi:hypothetical protein